MPINKINKIEFEEKIRESALSDKNKKRILALLADGEMTDSLKEKVREIIEADIEESTKELLTKDDKIEIQKITSELSKGLAKAQKDLEEDMKLVKDEMDDLETAIKSLDKVLDGMEIDSIRSSIKE